jgi:hypothetical protein
LESKDWGLSLLGSTEYSIDGSRTWYLHLSATQGGHARSCHLLHSSRCPGHRGQQSADGPLAHSPGEKGSQDLGEVAARPITTILQILVLVKDYLPSP